MRTRPLSTFTTCFVAVAATVLAQAPAPGRTQNTAAIETRALAIDDLFALQRVGDPQVSPDGGWVAYTVGTTSLKDEKSESRVWMIPRTGGDPVPMTAKGNSASRPRWSPDGRFLAFMASRGENAKTQVWVLNRVGGEAEQLTDAKDGVSSYEWSPDGTRLALVIRDPDPREAAERDTEKRGEPKTPPPWVIDRLQFKRDNVGYLDRRRSHVYVFDVASKALRQVTSGDFDDSDPVWSPDGRAIAFVSNRTAEPDANFNSDIWLVSADSADKGQTLIQLTKNPGEDQSPAWSPDGTTIAYVTTTDVKNFWYATNYLATITVPGADPATWTPSPVVVTQSLDRNVGSPEYAPDGKSIYFVLEDRGERHLAQVVLATGAITRPVSGARSVGAFDVDAKGALVALASEPTVPGEIFAVKGGSLEPLTTVNARLMAQVRLGEIEKIRFTSKDGTPVEGFLYKPVGYQPGMRYPTLLRIHGGPVSQFEASFNFESRLFAANGYVVVNVNPRGSSGYGQAFSQAIFADWGNRDYEDVMAGVDYAIEKGYADPDRLGIGGWSYGGMLTNYTITKTTRFKGAISGASLGLAAANYGHDHYQAHYEIEIGLPWERRDTWDRVSAFWQVDRITTPTLWICGEKDWNVPVINSEQMYQGMKRLGRTTQLVVYPGEHHGIRKPSYQKDRYERYLAWYDEHVKGKAKAAAPTGGAG